ncbi:MAG: type I-E CRISPR-associated endoribonuclease Cas2 [Magnetococcales bacterium]|nr:type I-E CRISPR-associated endoribonuclease Cas2 [Magnetococcales bacterium]
MTTRDVAPRFRGFLASCMLEIAPGVYVGPRINVAVRERIWKVMEEWFGQLGGGSVVMVWRDPKAVAGLQVRTLGSVPVEMVDLDGVILSKRPLTQSEMDKLIKNTAPKLGDNQTDS